MLSCTTNSNQKNKCAWNIYVVILLCGSIMKQFFSGACRRKVAAVCCWRRVSQYPVERFHLRRWAQQNFTPQIIQVKLTLLCRGVTNTYNRNISCAKIIWYLFGANFKRSIYFLYCNIIWPIIIFWWVNPDSRGISKASP